MTLPLRWSTCDKQRGIGVSAAINELVRAGMSRPPQPTPFHQRSAPVGLRIDVSNIGDVLDVLGTDDR